MPEKYYSHFTDKDTPAKRRPTLHIRKVEKMIQNKIRLHKLFPITALRTSLEHNEDCKYAQLWVSGTKANVK